MPCGYYSAILRLYLCFICKMFLFYSGKKFPRDIYPTIQVPYIKAKNIFNLGSLSCATIFNLCSFIIKLSIIYLL